MTSRPAVGTVPRLAGLTTRFARLARLTIPPIATISAFLPAAATRAVEATIMAERAIA